ncbi:DUF294 nucleotidyltransferase-like domain-containing protein [Tamlana sp. 2_MG-2023]|uniref:DUF294 nucleotidyltransferase-like domain-containing protein n=1 Tax=unclassified Tamlana TaxID=2614803 RepID=UPI0026E40B4F|nr:MULTISPECIES: DUF294 nucleotidyltransferase-like domain-containing protein [unclassified Tamlana]MDO6759235.1 DUF294 nucleotidyltransferase-like domain-containing protein [Tamlana sp. 2_MG-2023]MDO6790626.1 DUF294 nucleotidyltransferase-like domain-containing protein [Tamlana sp. 1_MG-2023]
MKNSIAERVLDYLIKYPPFNLLNNQDLFEISKEVSIIYLEKGDTLFEKGDAAKSDFYMVRNGGVKLLHTTAENTQEIVNISDAGDVFGIRPLIAKENYKLSATANEESIVYAIPISTFTSVTKNNASINKFLITAFATNAYDPYTAEENGKIFIDYLPNSAQDIVNFQTANYTKKPITCLLDSTIKDAAIKMRDHRIGCIIVIDDHDKPVGIITNSDIKNKIATGLFPIETLVTNIMVSPVITSKRDLTVAEGQLQMIKHHIGHLCITKDGTVNSKLVGVLTHHDVLATLGNNPSVILKEIKRANRTKKLRSARLKANSLLKNYLEQNIPVGHIVKVIAQINDAVTVRAIEIALKKMPTNPPVKFSWIALGSQGRKEQMLFTDQDNAIIFEDVASDKYEETQTYFLELAKLVTKSLNKVGFEYCEADMMASNPKWCISISQWKNQFEDWILHPDEKAILLSSIFFDFSPVYGEDTLAEELTNAIYKALEQTSIFFKFLGRDAIKNPSPLGFFKQFAVEKSQEQKDLFNIKNRTIMPLVDAARLLTLQNNIKGINNTADRFEQLALLDPNSKALYHSCSYAFKALSKFKTKQGILHNDSGKFIDIESLTKEEQLKLRRCLKPVHEIQEVIKIRFDLKNFI